ncbi:MAG: PAS domain-containing protein, partial [Candidatus Lokiarchaeota archaeon]
KNEVLNKSLFDILFTSDKNLKNLIKDLIQKKEPILNFKVFLKSATDQKLKEAILNIIPWPQNDNKTVKFRGICIFPKSKNDDSEIITLSKTKKNLSKQLVYNSLDEIVFHIDIKEKYKILNISKDNLIKLGYERAKLINISFLNLIYERDIYKFIDFIEKAIKKEKNFQIRLIDNKKKVFWFDIKEFEINTNTNHKILILKDISAEKVLIKKLNESEERLKLISDTIPEIRYWKLISPKAGKSVVAKSREMLETVIDTIPQYIFWKDASLKYLGCNKKFAQISGFGNHKSIIGKSDKDIPWLSSKSEEIRKIEKAIIASNKPQLNKIEDWKLPDGKRKWFEINRIPLYDPDNQPTGILSTFEDITDRKMAEEKLKESEQKYRGILENIKECYFEVDLKGNITFCNEAFLEQSEYSREEIIGLNFSKLVDDKNQKKIFLAFNKVYNSEVGLNDFKFKG